MISFWGGGGGVYFKEYFKRHPTNSRKIISHYFSLIYFNDKKLQLSFWKKIQDSKTVLLLFFFTNGLQTNLE